MALLSSVGFDVRGASGGRQALEAMQAEWPDAALLALRMPDMDGLELPARIRSMERGGRLPIVIVSASALEEEQVEVCEAGADDF